MVVNAGGGGSGGRGGSGGGSSGSGGGGGHEKKNCKIDYIRNPNTGRCVKIGSRTHNALMKSMHIESKKENKKTVKEIPQNTNRNSGQQTTTNNFVNVKTIPDKSKKIFLQKIKRFIVNNKKLLMFDESIKKYCHTHGQHLPETTYVEHKTSITYFSRNYFPRHLNDQNVDTFYSSKLKDDVVSSNVNMSYNNINYRYFKYIFKVRDTNNILEKQYIDYDWLNECNKYILNLTPTDRQALYSYTLLGDKYVNAYLRETPTIPIDYDLLRNEMKKFPFVNPLLFTYLHNHNLTQKFLKNPTMILFKQYKELILLLPNQQFRYLIECLANNICRILNSAPPLKQSMVLFRGTQTNYYQPTIINKPFINNGFLSATIDYSVALEEFTNVKDRCCLQVITILPGTRLLPLTGLSYCNDEKEFLINTGSKLMIRNNHLLPKPNSPSLCQTTESPLIQTTEIIIG